MQQQLINHSPDLKRLRDEGYEVEIKGGYLLSHHIPYVNSKKEVKFGTLVSELTLTGNSRTAKPNNHVICFIGEHPCNKDGSVITGIQNASHNETLYEGVTINHKFSNKPPNGYSDYYEKIKRYADIISAPAKSLDKTVTERTFRIINDEDEESVFHYYDTNASRANIQVINSKFKGQKIAIIGLGGTGAYILDLVAKTPVQEIHPYDGDVFLQHNAFRSPGAVSLEQLSKGDLRKAGHHCAVYQNMHKNIIPHDYYVTSENMHELGDYSYVFICVDRNPIRKEIMDYLIVTNIPFIDVGLGVNIAESNLVGTVRVTTGTPGKNDHLGIRVSCEDNENNEYATNIQIADLNCLNAALAVIKWKKLSGFYQDVKEEHHTTYSINVSQLRNEDTATPIR